MDKDIIKEDTGYLNIEVGYSFYFDNSSKGYDIDKLIGTLLQFKKKGATHLTFDATKDYDNLELEEIEIFSHSYREETEEEFEKRKQKITEEEVSRKKAKRQEEIETFRILKEKYEKR